MPEVTIVRRCHFTHPSGEMEVLEPGTYDLPDEMANHPFIQHHSDDPPPIKPRPYTPEYVDAQNQYFLCESLDADEERQRIAEAHGKAAAEFAEERHKRRLERHIPSGRGMINAHDDEGEGDEEGDEEGGRQRPRANPEMVNDPSNHQAGEGNVNESSTNMDQGPGQTG